MPKKKPSQAKAILGMTFQEAKFQKKYFELIALSAFFIISPYIIALLMDLFKAKPTLGFFWNFTGLVFIEFIILIFNMQKLTDQLKEKDRELSEWGN